MKQFFVDISNIAKFDLKTGIERVTRSVLLQLLEKNIEGYRIEPIYRKEGQYFYARQFTLGFLGIEQFGLEDQPIDVGSEDIYLALDLDLESAYDQKARDFLTYHQQRGLKLYYVIYDLLPVLNPEWFPEYNQNCYKEWITMISAHADGIIGISEATSNALLNWIDAHHQHRLSPLNVGYFHLGADIGNSHPTTGITSEEEIALKQLKDQDSLLMVGTVEPRKGHAQALDAMDLLWAKNDEKSLVIVGKKGWNTEELVQRIESHPEKNKKLFWFNHASDQLLDELYKQSRVFLMASQGEGFGLPLTESAKHELPIITRDLPVFREIAGKHAFYFSGSKGQELAQAIQAWFKLYKSSSHPRSGKMAYLTWQQSTDRLLSCIFENNWMRIRTSIPQIRRAS